MIVRRNLKLSIILRITWKRVAYFIFIALLATYLYEERGYDKVAIPFSAVAALGTALAIFLAFRNNSSYDRWWEARKLWGALVNYSRTWARQITTFAIQPADGSMSLEQVRDFHREMVHRHIAYNAALKLHLRKQPELLEDEIAHLFDERSEFEKHRDSTNAPASIAQRQAERLRDAYEAGMIDDFRHMRLDDTLTEFLNIQGGCERIKNTPFPRQYDYFPKIFVILFTTVIPFGMVEMLDYRTILLSLPISFIFFALENIGRLNEDPFENRIQDTPMSALCNTIERNLREQLGETELPEKMLPVDGFLF